MAAPKPIEKAKENSARRVLKQGHLYICGMCGSRYGSEVAAEACLRRCTKRYMDHAGVQDKPDKKARTVYRCIYCKRVYENINAAKDCARHCKQEIQKRAELEASLKGSQSADEKLKNLAAFVDNQLPPEESVSRRPQSAAEARSAGNRAASQGKGADKEHAAWFPLDEFAPMGLNDPNTSSPVHPAEGTKFKTEGDVYRCCSCHQKYRRFQDAISCYDLHSPELKAGNDSDEKFSRDGAKYVCRKCSKRWFSRAEVIACYDAHQAEELSRSAEAKTQAKAKAISPDPAGKDLPTGSRGRRPVARTDEDKFYRDGAKYVCRICSKRLFTRSEVIHCYDKHIAEEGGESPTTSTDTGPILAAQDIEAKTLEKSLKEVKVGSSRDGEDKFFRNGAKYVCRRCKSKYLTRDEVIECFDKH